MDEPGIARQSVLRGIAVGQQRGCRLTNTSTEASGNRSRGTADNETSPLLENDGQLDRLRAGCIQRPENLSVRKPRGRLQLFCFLRLSHFVQVRAVAGAIVLGPCHLGAAVCRGSFHRLLLFSR